ncbi:MAG: phosphoglycerate dehydrogenase [Nitrospirota bacterium]
MKILVSDDISPNGMEIMKKAGLEVDVKINLKPDDLIKEIRNYEGLVVRSATKVTADVINAADRLKVIARAGSGLDNVDKVAATKRGIVVMNTPGGNTITTAEHTIALMLSLARLIPQATASMKTGKWEKKRFMGVEVYNKTLGILGLGNIGSQVAKRAQGLQMNVIAYDPYLSEEKAGELGVEIVDLVELFRRADFISIHTPLTAETKGTINAESIKMMKDGVRIINCARGGVINEKDLYDALVSGKVAGAALDVFEKEPPEGSPLIGLNNVIFTPHLGASTTEAQENVAIAVAEQIVDYFIHGTVRNAVNIPSVAPDVLPKIKPFIELAEKLGSFESQIFEGGINQVTVEYRGEVAELDTAPLTIAVLKGLLTPILLETVNFVNAPFIARERGIEVKETKSSEAGNFVSLIGLKVLSGKKTGYVAGTLYNRRDPRMVQIDEFQVEAVPEGDMLVLSNNDKPGVIGNIGTTLGNNNINIARMQFGRERPGGRAISIVSVDTPVSEELLEKIKKLPNVISVKQIRL